METKIESGFDGESAFIMQEVLCVLKPGGVYILSDTGVGRKIQEIKKHGVS